MISGFRLVATLSLISVVQGTAIDNGVVGTPAIECNDGSMILRVTTRNPFAGRIFVKGESTDPKCSNRFQGGQATTAELTVSLGSCNVRRLRLPTGGLEYTSTIIVSFHPTFISKVDRAYHLHCEFKTINETVTPSSALDVSMLPTTEIVTQSSATVQCFYEIRKGAVDGPIARYVIVGEPVFHVWRCQTSAMRILVSDCFADDGQGNKVTTIDGKGCSVDKYIVSTPNYVAPNYTIAFTEAHVFKYADKPQVLFQCQIQLCDSEAPDCQTLSPPTGCAIPPLPGGGAFAALAGGTAGSSGIVGSQNASHTGSLSGVGGAVGTAASSGAVGNRSTSSEGQNFTKPVVSGFNQSSSTAGNISEAASPPPYPQLLQPPQYSSSNQSGQSLNAGNESLIYSPAFQQAVSQSPVKKSAAVNESDETGGSDAGGSNLTSSRRQPQRQFQTRTAIPPLSGNATLPTPSRFKYRHRLKHEAEAEDVSDNDISLPMPTHTTDVLSNELVVLDLSDDGRQESSLATPLRNALAIPTELESSVDESLPASDRRHGISKDLVPAAVGAGQSNNFCVPFYGFAILVTLCVVLFVSVMISTAFILSARRGGERLLWSGHQKMPSSCY